MHSIDEPANNGTPRLGEFPLWAMEYHTKLLQFRAPEPISKAIDLAARRELQTKSEYVRRSVIDRLRAPAVSIRRVWLPIPYRSGRVTRSRRSGAGAPSWSFDQRRDLSSSMTFGQRFCVCFDRFAIFISDRRSNDNWHAATFCFPSNSVAVTFRGVIGRAFHGFEAECFLQ